MVFGRMSVAFPRSVHIVNTRLAIVNWVITLGFLTVIVYPWIDTVGWYSIVEPIGNVAVFPKYWNDEQAAVVANQRDAQYEMCTNAAKFEYCDSPACEYYYKPTRCKDICAGDAVAPCINFFERWILEDRGKGLFFPTYLNETITTINQTTRSKDTVNMQSFLKGVEDMGLGFDHGFIVENLVNGKRLSGEAKLYKGGDANHAVLTVLKDSKGNVMSKIPPGDSLLSLSLKDVLAAGDINLNSQLNHFAGKNWAPGGDIRDGISLRLSGMEIILTMSYTNRHEHNWKGPVCEITVRASHFYSTYDETTVIDSRGSVRSRYYSGLRVSFESKGNFFFFEWTNVINFVATLLVYMRLAKQVSKVFATHFLGDISVVYGRVIDQRFSMRSTVVSETMKHITYASAFQSMQNSKGVLAEKDLYAALMNTFRANDNLGEREIVRMTGYIFDKMGLLKSNNDEHEPRMDISQYADACSLVDPIDSRMLARLFDVDQVRTCMERNFADLSVRDLFGSQLPKDAKESHESHATLERRITDLGKSFKAEVKDSAKELKDSIFAQKRFDVSEAEARTIRSTDDLETPNEQNPASHFTLRVHDPQGDVHDTNNGSYGPKPNECQYGFPMLDAHPQSHAKLQNLIRTHSLAHCGTVASLPVGPFTFPGDSYVQQTGTHQNGSLEDGAVKRNEDLNMIDIAALSITDQFVAVVDGLSKKLIMLETHVEANRTAFAGQLAKLASIDLLSALEARMDSLEGIKTQEEIKLGRDAVAGQLSQVALPDSLSTLEARMDRLESKETQMQWHLPMTCLTRVAQPLSSKQ